MIGSNRGCSRINFCKFLQVLNISIQENKNPANVMFAGFERRWRDSNYSAADKWDKTVYNLVQKVAL